LQGLLIGQLELVDEYPLQAGLCGPVPRAQLRVVASRTGERENRLPGEIVDGEDRGMVW
jgi:hypothetical protein